MRALNPAAHLCFYGLYAPAHEAHLRALGAGTVLGGEFEQGLVAPRSVLSAALLITEIGKYDQDGQRV